MAFKKYTTTIIILLMAFLCFYGCRSQDEQYPGFEKVATAFSNSKDTVIIPQQPGGNIKFYYVLDNWVKKAGIKEDENFTIRAWIGVGGLRKTQRVILIEKQEGAFSAQKISFDITVDTAGGHSRINEDSIINIRSVKVEPRSGWNSFSESFFNPGFLSLFDLKKDYGDGYGGGDEEGYYLEIIMGNRYWLSDFCDPHYNHSTSKDVLNQKKTFKLLEEEFDLR